MNITKYHAKYFAYELTRQLPSNDIGKLTASLQDAQVDLNPHQVEAALFAFQSPLSNGAILADEVGLGKTIEAGIILAQQWAERKRKLLIIAPSNLRKQWSQELQTKFFLPSVILEAKSFNQAIQSGNLNPFSQNDTIVICSYQFAKAKAAYLQITEWDLVIIDEAHRLRNVYKTSNVIGNAIKNALLPRKKVLLTATPLQNSILELFGLVSIIDEFAFGDLKSFKSQYNGQLNDEHYQDLRNRLQPVCQRTLRRQVLEYINYTNRRAIREEFIPSDDEQQLYDWVSEYLQRPMLYALPNSQRQLMTLILRKLLASSTYAIHGTLDTLVKRLEALLKKQETDLIDDLNQDYEELDEMQDEWLEGEEETETAGGPLTDAEIEAVKEEIEDLTRFRELAYRIKINSKAQQLLTALTKGFQQMGKLGANQKALIFTESRRTQDYLLDLLEAQGYSVVLFNGSNSDKKSKEIYKNWLAKNKETDQITGSATADKRAAIVEYFKENATIMIATEAAAEGVNLQFCSLVVNYDMPWNPQRIEQRIGRCHRYGQKFDVVVINFVNVKNAADIRIYQLLEQKFQLFDGVFGASDEVLGTIGNGVDFEKRIAQIYLECRSEADIKNAFDQLQEELKTDIDESMQKVCATLLENFDEAVREKLKINFEKSNEYLNAFEQKLWYTTRFYLKDSAHFADNEYSFTLNKNPFPDEEIHKGPYMILKRQNGKKKSEQALPDDANIYRAGHKLAQRILQECKTAETPTAEITFDYTSTPTKIALLEPFVGKSGWLQLQQLCIHSFEQEDYLLLACFADTGEIIDAETAARLFSLNATDEILTDIKHNRNVVEAPALSVVEKFQQLIFAQKQDIINENAERNAQFFETEMDKLDHWADDMKLSLEREIKDLDAEIKLRKAEAKKVRNLEEKVKAQRGIKDLEKKRSERRQTLFTAQDAVDAKKDDLLTGVENRLSQKYNRKNYLR